jgi:hypothetical protein
MNNTRLKCSFVAIFIVRPFLSLGSIDKDYIFQHSRLIFDSLQVYVVLQGMPMDRAA